MFCNKNSQFFLSNFLIFIFFLAFISQFFLVYSYSIDFPLSDEWDYFGSFKIPENFDLGWLVRPYNAHRIFPEHLLLWIHYKTNSLNFKIHQLTNFIFFNLFVLTFFKIARKFLVDKNIIIISLIFLYSCVAWEIHVWATCTTFYFCYIFGLWALYLSTSPNSGARESIIASCLAILSIFSFGGGVIFGGIILLSAILNVYNNRHGHKLKSLLISYTPYLGVILALIYWIESYEVCRKFAPPVTIENFDNFIPFFFTLMVGGFGFDWNLTDPNMPIMIGIIYFFIVLFGAIHLGKSTKVTRQAKEFILLSLLASVCLFLLIAYGRSNGGVLQALTSRYRLFSLATFPLVFMLYSQACFSRDVKMLCLGIFLVINVVNWRSHFDTFYYKDWYQIRKAAEECLQHSYREKDYNKFCNVLYHTHTSMLPLLESAKRMGINFTKRFS